MNAKQSLSYWLNSREGHYDPAVLNRLQRNQTAFDNYIIQCESDYQKSMQKDMERDAKKVRTLNEEMKEFLRENLWPMILRSADGDPAKAKEMIRIDYVARIVKAYKLEKDINEQYKQCAAKQL